MQRRTNSANTTRSRFVGRLATSYEIFACVYDMCVHVKKILGFVFVFLLNFAELAMGKIISTSQIQFHFYRNYTFDDQTEF